MADGDADLASPDPAPLDLEVTSGARAGLRVRFASGPVLVGRAADAGLRFDPEADLEVSGRHALLVRADGAWWIRDLESRNGTFVDGRRVGTEHPLATGQRIRFGLAGPEVAVRSAGEGPSAGSAARAVTATGVAARPGTSPAGHTGAASASARAGSFPRPTLIDPPSPGPARTASPAAGDTPSGRVRRLDAENRRLRRLLAIAAVLVLVVGAGAMAAWQRSRAAWEGERAALLARTDTLLERNRLAVADLEGELGGLRSALEASRAEVTELGAAVRAAEARGDGADLDALQERLRTAEVALTRQQLAASLDFGAIERDNRRALAMLFVESRPGEVATATAFGVRPDGTLATSRHAVRGADGSLPSRIGVQFSDSRQVWRGRVLAVSETADLALVKVDDIVGETPIVHGVNERADTLPAGTPVAVLGFPLAGRSERPVPLVSAGVVRAWEPGRVQIQGYGAEGASGSPVLDATGRLVAILYGGSGTGAARELVAVPAGELGRLLAGR